MGNIKHSDKQNDRMENLWYRLLNTRILVSRSKWHKLNPAEFVTPSNESEAAEITPIIKAGVRRKSLKWEYRHNFARKGLLDSSNLWNS